MTSPLYQTHTTRQLDSSHMDTQTGDPAKCTDFNVCSTHAHNVPSRTNSPCFLYALTDLALPMTPPTSKASHQHSIRGYRKDPPSPWLPFLHFLSCLPAAHTKTPFVPVFLSAALSPVHSFVSQPMQVWRFKGPYFKGPPLEQNWCWRWKRTTHPFPGSSGKQ